MEANKKFKAFDKVIVRLIENGIWCADLYSYYDTEKKLHRLVSRKYVADDVILPYEGNEGLIGTNLEGTTAEKTWSEQLQCLFKQAYEIADIWSNPLMNDAGGSMCCEYIRQDMDKWIKYFESWANQK